MGAGLSQVTFAPQPAFRGAASAAVSPYPMGHVPPAIKQQCTATLKASLNDLSNLKRAGVVNPNFMMTEKWLQVLSV